MDSEITIRTADSVADMLQVEDLQRVIWGGDETEVIPVHLLLTVAHNGGVLLGAFEGERMIGFVFGFLGTDEPWHGSSIAPTNSVFTPNFAAAELACASSSHNARQ
jgi:predicted GNAT superfamily acetyltransferase